MRIHDLILGIFFLLMIAGNVHAAGFDCVKASTEVEKMICDDDELSRLDESLNTAYLEALERPDIKEQAIKRAAAISCIKKSKQSRESFSKNGIRSRDSCGRVSSHSLLFFLPFRDGERSRRPQAALPLFALTFDVTPQSWFLRLRSTGTEAGRYRNSNCLGVLPCL